MHLTTLFLPTITAALAAALPQSGYGSSTGLPSDYHWDVENWTAGCVRAGCSYDFNVTGAKEDIYPAFKAYCSGFNTYETYYFQDCKLLESNSTGSVPRVAASLPAGAQDGYAKMSVSLKFTDLERGVTYNLTGHHDATFNAFVAPPQNFSVTPSEVTAVA